MGAEPGYQIDDGRMMLLKPESEVQFLIGGRNQDRPRFGPAQKLGIFVTKKEGLECLQRRRVLAAMKVQIRFAVLVAEGPRVFQDRIRIGLRFAESDRSVYRIAQIIACDGAPNVAVWEKVSQRVGGGIDRQTGAVPNVAGSKDGKHQENAGLPAPLLKCLPETGVAFGYILTRGDIEDATEAKNRVKKTSLGFILKSLPIALKQFVDETYWSGEIPARVADPLTHRLGHHETIAL